MRQPWCRLCGRDRKPRSPRPNVNAFAVVDNTDALFTPTATTPMAETGARTRRHQLVSQGWRQLRLLHLLQHHSGPTGSGGESISGEEINVNEKLEHKSLFRNLNSSLLTEHTPVKSSAASTLRRPSTVKPRHPRGVRRCVVAYESTKIGCEILDRTGRSPRSPLKV